MKITILSLFHGRDVFGGIFVASDDGTVHQCALGGVRLEVHGRDVSGGGGTRVGKSVQERTQRIACLYHAGRFRQEVVGHVFGV